MDEEQKNVSLKYFGIDRVAKFALPYKKIMWIMVVFGLLGSAADIVIPLFQRYAINHFIELKTLDTIVLFAVLYVLTVLMQSVVNFGATYLAGKVEVGIGRDLRRETFNHLQTLSFSYFNQNSVGYIHSRIMSDTSRIGELFSWVLMQAVWNVSYLIGAIIVMFCINAKLALVVLAIVPLVTVLMTIFQKRLVKVNREIRESNAKITGNFNEGITGAKTVKTLVIEDKIYSDFVSETKIMKDKSVKSTHYRALFASTISFFGSVALAIVLWLGGQITAEQAMEIGTLSVFMNYALMMTEPIRWIVDAASDLIRTQVNIERVSRLLGTQSDVSDTPEVTEKYGDTFTPKKENWEKLEGDIEFNDVTFKYPDGDEYILEHFNLKIPRGSSVAIVGETGAGKSTLANLVCRFFEPTEGKVLIDGRDARERSQLWLHSNIGYVLQTPHLFSGTVRDNLKYGNPDATDEQIYAALDRVSAKYVVDKMKDGLDSEVGEGGDFLSTGEKQLISFARAIIADPRILVLDEATASVDTITEQKIQKAISEIINGRTSIVIAHRLSTVVSSDVILVVRDGKIIERGKHTELMKAKGHYYQLFTRQFEEDAVTSVFGESKDVQ